MGAAGPRGTPEGAVEIRHSLATLVHFRPQEVTFYLKYAWY